MEFVTGVPLAVGVAALHALNSFLDDKRIAVAWYGPNDYKVFTRKRWINGKLGVCISHVFSIPESECVRLIADSLQSSQGWYTSRSAFGGECCWLPIYRSLKEKQMRSVVADAQSASFSLGAVGSLPAARINLWGLVVMAYANGAKQSIPADNGSYFAVLRARYFVLTIRRQSLADQAVAHIEPREQPYYTAQFLDEQAWRNLLEDGHTFGRTKYSGWPSYTNLDTDNPPANLVNGELDVQIQNEVIDDLRAGELKRRLVESVRKSRRRWEDCHEEMNARTGLIETQDPTRLSTIGAYQEKLLELTEAMKRGLEELVQIIETQPENAVECAQGLQNDPKQWFWYESKQLGQDWSSFEWEKYSQYGELMRWHSIIIVLIRFYVLSTKIDGVLSSRGTGDTALLADSAFPLPKCNLTSMT
jgi:hypothetical protein